MTTAQCNELSSILLSSILSTFSVHWPSIMRSSRLLLLAAAFCDTTFAFVILPNAFLTHTPAIHIEPEREASNVSPQDHPKNYRQKCHEHDIHLSPFDLSRLRPSGDEIADIAINEDDDEDPPLPVIIWHGLGDQAGSDGMKAVGGLLNNVSEGTYIYEVAMGAGSEDQRASFFGQLTTQLAEACEKIGKDNILQTAPAVDLLGFSQGGLFLRGLIETCDRMPPVRTLLTFGGPHNGIAKFQRCKDTGDWVCRAAEALVSTGGVFTSFVQGRVVPAQYFRDPRDLDTYLEESGWLADVNNERNKKNETYAERLARVEKFVMVLFEDDETVVPKESTWFADVNLDTGKVTDLKDRPIYQKDWIGLKQLDKKGALVFESVKGRHMRFTEKDLKRFFGKYFGVMEDKTMLDKAWDLVDDTWESVPDWATEL